MQVQQLQKAFSNDYYPVWTLLYNQKIYPFGTNKKSDSHELWKQHKWLKTMKISEAWPDIFYERCIHQFQPEPTQKMY